MGINIAKFISKIEDELIEKYDVDPAFAEYFMALTEMREKLSENEIWTQTMGVSFWAREIAEIIELEEEKPEHQEDKRIKEKSII